MLALRFGADDLPADILDVTGRWLAEQFDWRWVKSRHSLELRSGPQVRRLILSASKWNRRGVSTRVRTRISVLDDDLTAWRKANPSDTIFSPAAIPTLPFVYNLSLGTLDSDLAAIECSGLPQHRGPAPADPVPEEFAARFSARVMPVLELFESPRSLADELPDPWLTWIDSGAIEWALAKHDLDAASRLLRGHLAQTGRDAGTRQQLLERVRQGWQDAPSRDRLPQLPQWAPESLGWLAKVHGLPGAQVD
jgi:hypothetical protein